MKRIKRFLILIMLFMLISTPLVGVYAWFTLQPSTEALDLNARSVELISARTSITIGNDVINYNSSNYDDKNYAIRLTRNDIINYSQGNDFPIDINTIITPLKTINVRIKLVEVWTVNNTVVTRPNVFTWGYEDPLRVDDFGYYNYDNVLAKSNEPVVVDLINGASVNTGNIPNNAVVKLSVIISAVQSNRSSIWNLDESNHVTNEFVVGSLISDQQLSVRFTGVSNEQMKRGVYVEFKSGANHYSYIWHTRGSLTDRLTLPAGTYTVTTNLVNHLDFVVTRSGDTIYVDIEYADSLVWGFEDILYAPTMIPTWQPGVIYQVDNMVYYEDADNNGENAGYYISTRTGQNWHPDETPWAWEIVSIHYMTSRVYYEGEIIYFTDGKFYRAKATVWPGTTPPSGWAWELLGKEYTQGNEYSSGETTFYMNDGVKQWYITYGGFTAHPATPQDYQAMKLISIDYSTHNRGKYKIGEYVYYQGNYYIVTSNDPWNAPANNSNGFRRIGKTYVSRPYSQNFIVTYNNNYYIALNNTSATPGNPNWQVITHQGTYDPQTSYTRYQSVIKDGKRFFYNAPGTSTGLDPATTSTWWLLDDDWHPHNTYVADSIVSHNGELYVLRTGSSTNQEPGVTGAWQPLSLQWSKTGMYYNSGSKVSAVMYNNAMYHWTGANNATNTPIPGESRNGWVEMTDVWIPNNVYHQGDYVIYDGSFWELLVPTNPEDFSNVPGVDFNIWKEHPIVWDPNRN